MYLLIQTDSSDNCDYYKVGDRWGKLVPLEEEDAKAVPDEPVPTGIIKNASDDKQMTTRKSPRQAAKPAKESGGMWSVKEMPRESFKPMSNFLQLGK